MKISKKQLLALLIFISLGVIYLLLRRALG